MHIDPLTILATMVNFLIIFLILRHFLFKPITSAIDNRENEIKTRISNSEENEKKAEKLRIENENKLMKADQEGKKIVDNYKVKAESESKKIIEEANISAQQLTEKGKKELQLEISKANEEIKSQVIDLAVMLSKEALESSLDEVQHRKLIEQFIAKVGI